MKRFNVVLMGTGKVDADGNPVSNFPGIITWQSFESEEDFQKWWQSEPQGDILVKTGVTESEAVGLVAQTTGEARARYAHHMAQTQPGLAEVHYQNGKMAAFYEGHLEEYIRELLQLGVDFDLL